MNAQDLIDAARTLVAGDKGLPAIDESNQPATVSNRIFFLRIPIPLAEILQ